jgi:hypothetical protein
VEKLLLQEQEARKSQEYIRGYSTMPETVREVEAAHRAGSAVLAEEPWA